MLDSRRVLLRHANWSPIDGRRGQIEDDVLAVDASAANDWSEVRVWYAPIGDLGTTAYPIHGFIYPESERSGALAPVQVAAAEPPPIAPSRTFLSVFASLEEPAQTAPRRQLLRASRADAPADLLAQLRR